jgi:hypothetical protein
MYARFIIKHYYILKRLTSLGIVSLCCSCDELSILEKFEGRIVNKSFASKIHILITVTPFR